jgi:leucyl-tRNA synthetase
LDQNESPTGQSLRVFTTRPDTIFGATYMVVAPEHPLVDGALDEPTPETDEAALRAYVEAARNRSDVERMEGKEKTGVFTGYRVLNPANGQPIPVWTSDYVLMGYGTGAIMAVPGQDQRDWDFAKAFALPIVRTVRAPAGFEGEAYVGEGPAINSGFLDGLGIAAAKAKIIDWLERNQIGTRRINYRLRDWLFSRQRYWGEPFPIVWDELGHHVPVAESALPVRLPEMADYAPVESEDPQPLLAKATDWVETTAGEAGAVGLPPDAAVRRETNTMPGWAGSCWYYLRYCDSGNDDRFVGMEAERYWMSGATERRSDGATEGDGGVDLYIGGSEHAVLHLLYARFWHKVLFDLGHVSTQEPFKKLFHQGLITSHAFQRDDKSLVAVDAVDEVSEGVYVERDTGRAVTKITAKMSKSLKNVVNPDDVIHEFGADTFRLYEMYMGPLEASKPWNTNDTIGLFRFLQRAWRLAIDEESGELKMRDEPDEKVEKQLHRTIARVAHDVERLAFNTAIAAMIELVNAATSTGGLTRDQLDRFARVLAPFAPHMGEELWHRLGHEGSVAHAPWPAHDDVMLRDDEVEIVVQISGKVRAKIMVPADADAGALERIAMADEKVRQLIEGKTVRKVIAVPGRLVNIVAN